MKKKYIRQISLTHEKMFLKILREDERFRVYSDKDRILHIREEYREEGMRAMQINYEDMTFSGFCFTGQTEWMGSSFACIYAVVSFKENPLEHIEGCFPWGGGDRIRPRVLPIDYDWFSCYIKNMKSARFSDDEKKRIGWKHGLGGKKIDVENDLIPYYVLGNIRIKLELMGFGQSIPLDVARALGREQFAEQKRIKFTPKAPTDCKVVCDSLRNV